MDVPVVVCAGALGCFRVLDFRNDPDGKRSAFGGDGWLLGGGVRRPARADSVLANRERHCRNPHDTDQAELFARGEMKKVLFLPKDVEAGVVRRYRPAWN